MLRLAISLVIQNCVACIRIYTMLKGQAAAQSVLNSLPFEGFYSIQFGQIACWAHTEAQYGQVVHTSFSYRTIT